MNPDTFDFEFRNDEDVPDEYVPDEDDLYMRDVMDCVVCKRNDIPRYLLHWIHGGCVYTDTCEACYNDKYIQELKAQDIKKDEEIARLTALLNSTPA